jgi:hypothetical protein
MNYETLVPMDLMMRLPRVRFTVRWMMGAVAVVALILCVGRFYVYRRQAASYARSARYWSWQAHEARSFSQGSGVSQGQRALNRCSCKDFRQEVFVPPTTAAFHREAQPTGVLLQE